MGNTANRGLPYPENTDPLANMAAAVQALANALDGQRPSVSVAKAAAQSIPNNAFTDITFDTETFDSDTMFTATSANVTVKHAGLWLITARVGYITNGTGSRGATLLKNGGTVAASLAAASSVSHVAGVTAQLRLAVNDVIKLQAFQNSGAALNTNNVVGFMPSLEMTWVGP